MEQKPSFKIFLQILRHSFVYKAVGGYLVFFLVTALVMMLSEPSIYKYSDALWYAFVSSSTIGFGDFAATTPICRILTVILYLYMVLILALVTAVFTQFFFEIAKARRNESVALFQHDLEHLEDLPKERLAEISATIREHVKKN